MAQETRQQQFSASDGSAAVQQPAAQQPAAQQPSPTPSPQSQQQGPRPCPQDCNRCSISQQVFCSTKMLFDLSRAYQETRQQLAEVTAAIAGIQAQLQHKDGDVPLSTPFIEAT